MATKTVPAGTFKQTCLALLDEVLEHHVEIVVTKRGRPVARVVPIADAREQEEAVLARLRGRVKSVGRQAGLLEPTQNIAGWGTGTKAE